MNFKIYIIGGKIDKFYSEAIKEYKKRLSRYCRISVFSLKNEIELHKNISEKSYRIIVTTTGKSVSSEDLAGKINALGISGISDISLIIGADIVEHNEAISISPMEMDLGLKMTIIFEQIYRSYRIINNEPYHK